MKIKLLVPIIILIIIVTIYVTSDVRFLTVTGTSMNPRITQDDIVIVVPADIKSLEIGDIITYKLNMGKNRYLFTHRIVGMDNGIIKTRGDNMPETDGYSVMYEDVVGKVIAEIPYIGYMIRFSHTTIGYLTLILIPSIILIVIEIKKIISKN